MPVSKRLVPVSEPVVSQLSVAARRLGLSLSELVEHILGHVAKVLQEREDIDFFVIESVIRHDMYRLGGVTVPLTSLIGLLESVDEEVFRRTVDELARFSETIAVSVKLRGLAGSIGVEKLVRLLLPGVPVTVMSEGGESRIILASPLLYNGRAQALALASLRSIISGLGGTILGTEVEKGVIVVRYRMPGEEGR